MSFLLKNAYGVPTASLWPYRLPCGPALLVVSPSPSLAAPAHPECLLFPLNTWILPCPVLYNAFSASSHDHLSLSSQIQPTCCLPGHLLRPPNPKPPADTTPTPPRHFHFFCFISFLCGVRFCVTKQVGPGYRGSSLRAGPPACLADLCVPSTQISAWHLVSTQYILC